jgi:glycosyltransferase involved in cell wall biosynthesis
LAQSWKDIEVLVVDDRSEDGSVALVEEYAKRDARVVLHENPQRLGLTQNFNQCLRLARGNYVKFLCADDVLDEQCVERMVVAFKAEPGAMLVGCRRYFFNDDKRIIGERGYGRQNQIVRGQRAIRKCFFSGNLIGEPTAVLFRKADALAGFDENYHQALDMELWFRLLENGSLIFLADTLCGVREHVSRGTANNLRAGKITADKLRLFEQYAKRPYLAGTMGERVRWDARMASSVTREVAAGVRESAKAVKNAFYFPRFSSSVLIPLASVVTKIRRKTGII